MNQQNQFEAVMNRGHAYLERGDYERAIAEFSTAIECSPNSSAALIARAKASYLWSVRTDMPNEKMEAATNAAIADCNAAIQHDPGAWKAFQIRGRCLGYFDYDEEAWRNAITDFSRVIELQPQLAQAYADRADAYLFEEPDYNKLAHADASRALALDPANVTALFVRGQLAFSAGDYRQAIQDFTAILQSRRDIESEIIHVRGMCCGADVFREEAQRLLNMARETQRQPRHNAPSELLFWGDGICPNCHAAVWIEWKLAYPISQMIQCHACHARWDVEQAVSIVFSHVPEDNAPESSLAKIRQYIAIKKATEGLVEQVEAAMRPAAENNPQPAPQQHQVDPYGPAVETRLARMRRLARSIQQAGFGHRLGIVNAILGAGPRDPTVLMRLQQYEEEFFRLRTELEGMGIRFKFGPGEIFIPE